MADPTANPPDTPSTKVTPQPLGDGLSAVERAAKIGLGPMSPLAQRVWHGDSKPCVSCGELVRITDNTCRYCSQDLSVEMLIRMQQHSGPWYVLEHVRPFPGVSMERLIRQANRGIVTATTIVRGPYTDHQWRFAALTPELCKYVGACWNCQAAATSSDTYCHHCAVNLDRPPGEVPPAQPMVQSSSELDMLSDAIRTKGGAQSQHAQPQRSIPAWVIAGAFLVVAIGTLLIAVNSRGGGDKPKPTTDSTPSTASTPSTVGTPSTVSTPSTDDTEEAQP